MGDNPTSVPSDYPDGLTNPDLPRSEEHIRQVIDLVKESLLYGVYDDVQKQEVGPESISRFSFFTESYARSVKWPNPDELGPRIEAKAWGFGGFTGAGFLKLADIKDVVFIAAIVYGWDEFMDTSEDADLDDVGRRIEDIILGESRDDRERRPISGGAAFVNGIINRFDICRYDGMPGRLNYSGLFRDLTFGKALRCQYLLKRLSEMIKQGEEYEYAHLQLIRKDSLPELEERPIGLSESLVEFDPPDPLFVWLKRDTPYAHLDLARKDSLPEPRPPELEARLIEFDPPDPCFVWLRRETPYGEEDESIDFHSYFDMNRWLIVKAMLDNVGLEFVAAGVYLMIHRFNAVRREVLKAAGFGKEETQIKESPNVLAPEMSFFEDYLNKYRNLIQTINGFLRAADDFGDMDDDRENGNINMFNNGLVLDILDRCRISRENFAQRLGDRGINVILDDRQRLIFEESGKVLEDYTLEPIPEVVLDLFHDVTLSMIPEEGELINLPADERLFLVLILRVMEGGFVNAIGDRSLVADGEQISLRARRLLEFFRRKRAEHARLEHPIVRAPEYELGWMQDSIGEAVRAEIEARWSVMLDLA